MHATIGAACWLRYTFPNTFSIKVRLHNYVRPVYVLSISKHTYIHYIHTSIHTNTHTYITYIHTHTHTYIHTNIQASMLKKTGDVTLGLGSESPCIHS